MAGPERGPGEVGRWCERHGRWECTKQRPKGRGQCHGTRISGLDTCRMHAGMTAGQARAKGQARISAWSAAQGGETIDPATAMLGMLTMSWLRVHFYSGLLQAQSASAGQGDGGAGTRGLVGGTFAASAAAGGVYATGERARALVDIEYRERELCARLARMAHEMGIAEAQQELAERWASAMESLIQHVIEGLDLDDDQWERVPIVVPAAIRRMGEVIALPGAGEAA